MQDPVGERATFAWVCLGGSNPQQRPGIVRVIHRTRGDVQGGPIDPAGSLGGGQRKRVNIGLELAARPKVLMLDEPTSGLDASTALEIIRSVKRLTGIGRA